MNTTLSSRLHLDRRLGAGAFGEVHHGWLRGNEGLVKEVAVKLLRGDAPDQPELARRLRDEARLLGLLQHRAIVRVDRLTQMQGRWAVIMEYVDGVDLGALLKQGPVPAGPALEIVAELAGALRSAWFQHGPDGQPLHLTHRDIKPSNVLLTPHGEVKLLDFGVARACFDGRESHTTTGFVATPLYMAPERGRGERGGHATDIYGLGLLLFELIAGWPVGKSDLLKPAHDAHIGAALENLDRWVQPAPDLMELLRRCLAFEPARRPNADALQRELLALRAQHVGEGLVAWSARAVGAALAEGRPAQVRASPAPTTRKDLPSLKMRRVEQTEGFAPAPRRLPARAPLPPPPVFHPTTAVQAVGSACPTPPAVQTPPAPTQQLAALSPRLARAPRPTPRSAPNPDPVEIDPNPERQAAGGKAIWGLAVVLGAALMSAGFVVFLLV